MDSTVNRAALLLFLWSHMLYHAGGTTVTLPFTHDFNTGLHGWYYSGVYWDWTGNATRSIDTRNIPSFYSVGNHVWTQKPLPLPYDSATTFALSRVQNVSMSTFFSFRFWFYTSNPHMDTGLYIELEDLNTGHIYSTRWYQNYMEWIDYVIDCNDNFCCQNRSTCDVHIRITGSVGDSDGDGIASIACVTTEDMGCGANPTPPPGSSPHTSKPNHLIIISFIFIMLIVYLP